MSTSLANQYYLKALQSYAYGYGDAFEALEYALSYDEDHCHANYLMGMLYMHVLKQYDQAEYYFQKALESNLNFPDTYKALSLLKIWKGEFDQALKVIDHGLKVRGMDRGALWQNKAKLYEYQADYSKAIRVLKRAKAYAGSVDREEFYHAELMRLQAKLIQPVPGLETKSKRGFLKIFQKASKN